MKKLLCAACAVVLLAGCGGAKKETKTCSQNMGTMNMSATFTAEDDTITKTSVKVSVDASMAGVKMEDLSDEDKETMKTAMLNQMGIESGKGVETSVNFTDDAMEIVIDIDMKDGDKATLKKLNLADETKLSDMVKSAEKGGATCK